MALSIKKENAIRQFLKEIYDENFVKFVERALEGWEIAIPMKRIFGIFPNYISETWKANGPGCCLYGAASLNRSFNIVNSANINLVISEIIVGFDSPDDTLYGIRKHTTDQAIWAAKISKIIFD